MREKRQLSPGDTIRAEPPMWVCENPARQYPSVSEHYVLIGQWFRVGAVAVVLSVESMVPLGATEPGEIVTLLCLDSGAVGHCWDNQIRSAEIIDSARESTRER